MRPHRTRLIAAAVFVAAGLGVAACGPAASRTADTPGLNAAAATTSATAPAPTTTAVTVPYQISVPPPADTTTTTTAPTAPSTEPAPTAATLHATATTRPAPSGTVPYVPAGALYKLPPAGTLADGGQPVGSSAGPGQVNAPVVDNAQMIGFIHADFPASQWADAEEVFTCESGMTNKISPPNSNGTFDYGVAQLNSGGTLQDLLAAFGYPGGDLNQALDASWNVKAAALLYSQRGWEPWTCAHKLGIWTGSTYG